jgi:hypothetical protein
LNRRDLKLLPREPLSREDDRVLQQRFSMRRKSFLSTGAIIIILIIIEAGPMTEKINVAIKTPELRWLILSFIVVMSGLVFYRRVWVFQRDRRAGFKYVDRKLIISRNPPHGDGSFSIDLEDLAYHNLKLDSAAYERLQPGDRYPVGFAAHSGYALTRAAALMTRSAT